MIKPVWFEDEDDTPENNAKFQALMPVMRLRVLTEEQLIWLDERVSFRRTFKNESDYRYMMEESEYL